MLNKIKDNVAGWCSTIIHRSYLQIKIFNLKMNRMADIFIIISSEDEWMADTFIILSSEDEWMADGSQKSRKVLVKWVESDQPPTSKSGS
jgi:hypothetical protein